MFYKRGDLKNFWKFLGKHLCRNLFSNKVAGCPGVSFLTKLQAFFFAEHLRATVSDILNLPLYQLQVKKCY